MHSAERSVQQIISLIDTKIWDSLAIKVIKKMVPNKEAESSLRMMNDFTVMLANQSSNKKSKIEEVKDHVQTFQENYIIGLTKMTEKSARSMSCNTEQPAPSKIDLKSTRHGPKSRMKTESLGRTQTQQNKKEKVKEKPIKKNPFFMLTFQEQPKKQEQKMDDYYRNTKYSDIQYAKDLQEARKELDEQRQHRKIIEAKRFKQMKNYTYDFDGKLVSLGVKKQSEHKVVNMKSQFSEEYKKKSLSPSRKSSNKQVSYILDKKLVHIGKTPQLDPISELAKKKRQKQQQEQHEKKKHIFNTNKASNKFNNLFNKDTRVELGIKITNVENKEFIEMKDKQLTDTKRFTLTQFKNYAKTREDDFFPSRRNLKLRKNNTKYKTEADEFFDRGVQDSIERTETDRLRIKTQGGDRTSSKFMSTYRKTGTGRGTIHIKHEKLYTEHFSPRKSQA